GDPSVAGGAREPEQHLEARARYRGERDGAAVARPGHDCGSRQRRRVRARRHGCVRRRIRLDRHRGTGQAARRTRRDPVGSRRGDDRHADDRFDEVAMITVLVADDHPLLRKGLREVLDGDPELQVVAGAGRGEAALAQVESHRPDVLVLDIDMPKRRGLDVVRELQRRRLTTGVIILSLYADEALVTEALDLGALGYILKEDALGAIVEGVKAV